MSGIVEQEPQSLTEQAITALKCFEPMVAIVVQYGDLTVEVDGIGKVEEAHKALKRLRIDVDNKRSELNAPALEYQRTVNATAKELIGQITVAEGKLKAQRDVYDAEKLKEKQAKEAAKALLLNQRVSRLSKAGIVFSDLATIGSMQADEFEFFFAKESRLAAEAKAESDRLEALRQEELKRQAEELRIRAEAIERQRLADEAAMAEERARLKAQREAEEARQAEEQKEIERQRKITEDEWRRQREQIEAERTEMRRQQEELARHQAEVKAKAEAEERERLRVEREAEQARREAAAAPELEKLESVRKTVIQEAQKTLNILGSPAWSESLIDQIHAAFDFARGKIRESL
jgi:DNA repair exonuclease SbcCD ATPase subunit